MSELTALVVVRQDALTLRSIYTRCVRVLECKGRWRSCTGGDLLEARPYRDWATISNSALWGKHPRFCIVCYNNAMCT